MAKLSYDRTAIGALAERLEIRGTSRLLRDRPELCSDMKAAAAILRQALENGWPVSALEISIDTNGGSNGK